MNAKMVKLDDMRTFIINVSTLATGSTGRFWGEETPSDRFP